MSLRQQDERRCENCGAEVCDVRVNGEWLKADWPPVAPVIEFRRFIVAQYGNYSEIRDGEIKPAEMTYDGFRVPGVPASILVVEHDCEALTELKRVYTKHGAESFAAFEREPVDG